MSAPDARQAAERVKAFYEQIEPAALDGLDRIYTPDAYFRDPFHEVRGIGAIRSIFAKMFVRLADCRFRVLDTVAEGSTALLTWDLTFRFPGSRAATLQTIHGASHLKFDASGRVIYHRDYWDAAGELYEKLPLVGPLLRHLKRRMR